MRLREVVFQGVFGLTRPARVRIDPGFCNLSLPPGVSPSSFRDIILSLLFPQRMGADELRPLVDDPGADIRLGLVVESAGGEGIKLARRLADTSISAFALEGPQAGSELARGAAEVGGFLAQTLPLPDYARFRLLHLWEHPTAGVVVGGGASRATAQHPPEVARLLEMHALARKLEIIDTELDSIVADLSEARRRDERLRKNLERVRKRRARRDQIRTILDLSDDDKSLITDFKAQDRAQERRIDEMAVEAGQVADQRDASVPAPLNKDIPLAASLVVALVLFIVSAVIDMRALALLNVFLLGVGAWRLVRRYDIMEQHHALGLRVDQLHRHAETLKESRQETARSHKALLERLGLEDPDEFAHLADELEEHERALKDTDFEELDRKEAESASVIEDLQASVSRLEAQKSALGECHLPAYEIESQLARMGVDVYSNMDSYLTPDEDPDDPFVRYRHLKDAASDMGLFRAGRLRSRPLAAWHKMLTHVMGRDWGEAGLDATGVLIFGDRTAQEVGVEPEAARLAAGFLAAALLASASEDAAANRFMCLIDPYRGLAQAQAQRLDKIFDFLGKTHHLLVFGVPEPSRS